MTKYTIYSINGAEQQWQTLTARTDEGARRQMQRYLQSAHGWQEIYLEFFRASDGQHGYINRNGADLVGKSWI